MRKTLILITGLALAVAAGGAAAGPHRGGPGGHHGFGPDGGVGMLFHMMGHIERVADELGISDAQRNEIRALIDGAMDQVRPVADALRDNRDALHEASDPDTYDDAAVAQLAEAQGDLITQLILIKSQTRANVLAVLTPEQREQLDTLREERRQRRFGG